MPLDTDNDLLIINDAITPAVGEVSHLTGRVLTMTGQPVRNAFVEIWQVDSTASYVHTGGRQPTGHDRNFQGYGRFLTDSKGQYYFRTIKPISYTLIGIFRTAHIHLAISRNGRRVFTTQLLVKGHPDNARDSIVKRLDPKALDTVLADFIPVAWIEDRRAGRQYRYRARQDPRRARRWQARWRRGHFRGAAPQQALGPHAALPTSPASPGTHRSDPSSSARPLRPGAARAGRWCHRRRPGRRSSRACAPPRLRV